MKKTDFTVIHITDGDRVVDFVCTTSPEGNAIVAAHNNNPPTAISRHDLAAHMARRQTIAPTLA